MKIYPVLHSDILACEQARAAVAAAAGAHEAALLAYSKAIRDATVAAGASPDAQMTPDCRYVYNTSV
jgi:hypothetical protein